MKNKVLIVVAHTDDETFGMGGTISKHSNNGDDIFAVALTDGVGARDSNRDIEIQERIHAAHNASKTLGFDWIKLHQYPDNQVD